MAGGYPYFLYGQEIIVPPECAGWFLAPYGNEVESSFLCSRRQRYYIDRHTKENPYLDMQCIQSR